MSNHTFYKHVVVDVPHPYMKFVVGKKGKILKSCREKTGVDSVWFNMKRNVVEIYGPSHKLEEACNYVRKRIDDVRLKVPKDELEAYKHNMVYASDSNIVGSLDNALSKEKVKFLIGKKGRHFKRITKEADVSFIWYDDTNHNIMIWGPPDNLNKAVSMLFEEIGKVNKIDMVEDMDVN